MSNGRQERTHRIGSLREERGESFVGLHEQQDLLVGLLVACTLLGFVQYGTCVLTLLLDLRKLFLHDGVL